ncbi:RNA polymerase sigma factor [Pseudocolwellia sp. AS88]|uniref:RNA polymerase sigma factor n=1 Tax=Pseudocolwellia sp. AS88 TaxID=3063958 RepID=UPI0026EE3397|nr:RNA polymerase sigma factor [Pseudocolwellia sp. AS88]MDO7085727.1 RNA polymerase sigma factor [Pseudocolwellia sp. AS88]
MKNQIIALVPMIRRFAYSLTGNQHDADDLLQNTIERILTKGVPENVELNKWMFRVCRNLWIDEYRSRKVRQTAAESPELTENQIVNEEKQQNDKISLQQVNNAMDVLPHEQRSILSLVAIQGMSYKEVSETLEIPIGTVMSRLSRARISLSQCLNNSTGVMA